MLNLDTFLVQYGLLAIFLILITSTIKIPIYSKLADLYGRQPH